jgi:hypothetical protein
MSGKSLAELIENACGSSFGKLQAKKRFPVKAQPKTGITYTE